MYNYVYNTKNKEEALNEAKKFNKQFNYSDLLNEPDIVQYLEERNYLTYQLTYDINFVCGIKSQCLSYIYVHPNLGRYCTYEHTFPNGKKYVGQCANNKQRNYQDRWQNGEGYKENKEMYEAIQQYGWDNIQHEIKADRLSKDCSLAFESYWIQKEDSYRNGYNQNEGGVGRSEFDEEDKQKHSEAQKGTTKETLPIIAITTDLKQILHFPNQLAAQKYKHRDSKEILNPNGLEGVWQSNISKKINQWKKCGDYYFFSIAKDGKIHIKEEDKDNRDKLLEELTGLEVVYDKEGK